METIADVVEEITSAEGAGFDVSTAKAERTAQDAVKRLAAASQWIKAELELGPTVVGQAGYSLPDKIVRLLKVAVGENMPYQRKEIEELWDLRSGRDQLVDPAVAGGVFAERFAADGTTKSFDVFPTPEEAGLPITGLASIVPDDLVAGVTLPFPSQYRGAILDFGRAILYEQTDENIQQAAYYEKRAVSTAEGLYLLGNSRSGSGPHKARVAGHARR